MMWLNWSITAINATLQLLDIYRYRLALIHVFVLCACAHTYLSIDPIHSK